MKLRKPSARGPLALLVSAFALFFFACGSTAYAYVAAEVEVAASSDPTALARLRTEVLNVLIPVIVSLAGYFFVWIANKVRKKLDIEISDKQMDSWEKLARRAARFGAEWAREQVKDLGEGQKVPGPDVLEVAANWAIDTAKDNKLPDMAREKLIGLIRGELFDLRSKQTEVNDSVS